MNSLFILHPVGFILFLVLGVGTFFLVATKIHIPVYTTVETVVEEENGRMCLNLEDNKFEAGTPVYLYQSRDDHLEKVTAYEVREGWLLTDFIDTLPKDGRLYADIQTDEISLLRHIFTEGGNISL